MLLALLIACSSHGPADGSPDASADPIAAYDPLPLVDPFIATGGEGAQIANVNPGATLPWGMTHVGPDTRKPSGAPSFYHCAGYWWNDTHIHGFSHTHAHGMGVTDFGGVAFMPVDGWDPAYTRPAGRAASFSHDAERARPGSYGVTLDDGVDVEIVATRHGGHTRVTWPDGADPVLILDLGPSVPDTSVPEAWVDWAPGSTHLAGYQLLSGNYSGRFGGLKTSFAAELSVAPASGGGWDDADHPVDGETHAEGAGAGVWLRFPAGTRSVDLRLALSYVDAEGAEANLAAELPDGDHDARRAEAEAAWTDVLSRVRVRGGTDEERVIFHTALFHAAIMPRRYDDVDGRYRGLDGEVHTTDHPYYSDMSLWDTFRTVHPWYVLAWPDVQLDVARSLVRMAADGGALPRWPLGHGYTGGMVGTPAAQVLAETWLKGLRDFDADAGFASAAAQSDGPVPHVSRGGVGRYAADGWVAVDDAGGSVSLTLEYAWSDRSLALWGDAMGKDTAALRRRSEGWDQIWNPELGFFVGRCADPSLDACTRDGVDDGWAWVDAPRPDTVWLGTYVEGDAWHYLWYVPYDVDRMIEVQHGDREAFLERYRAFWYDGVFVEPDDVFPDDLYWHGNEPVMHYAFLGALAGDPDTTADASRWILSHRYRHDPIGLDGNDDAGTLSSWYLLASTGLFPIAGTTTYAVASPLFERVEIDGADLVVRAPGTSDARRYVDGVDVDGVDAGAGSLDHAQVAGHELTFRLRE